MPVTQKRTAMHLITRHVAGLAALVLGLAAPVFASAADPGMAGYICPMGAEPRPVFDKPGFCPGGGMELVKKSSLLRVAVLVFEGVEEIDYAGPIEVFGASG